MEISEVATELAEEAVSVGVGIGAGVAGGEGGVGVAGSRRVNWFGVGELNIQGDPSTHIYLIYVSIYIYIYIHIYISIYHYMYLQMENQMKFVHSSQVRSGLGALGTRGLRM